MEQSESESHSLSLSCVGSYPQEWDSEGDPAHEIQAMADCKPDYGVKEVSSDLQTLSSPYFCF